MQLVLLAGELGEKYGQQHEYYNLQTPADAIKLLCINYPALKAELIQAHQNGVGYKVIQGGAAMGYDELQLPFGSKPLLVVPVITGSGGGPTTQILVGIGLVAASFLIPGAGAFGIAGLSAGAATAGATAAALGTAAGAIGTALILSGTASLISPQPQLPSLGANRIKGNGTNVRGTGPTGVTRGASGVESYAFTGPANTVGTGATLPVIYGRVITGSHLLAVNLEISDDSDPLMSSTRRPRVGTATINGEQIRRKLEPLGGLDTKGDVRVINSSNSNQRIKVEETFGPSGSDEPLEEGSVIKHGGLDYKSGTSKRENIDVLFQVFRGLYQNVGAVGTTKIDGFITYEMKLTVTRDNDEGGDVVVATARATVQALTVEKQSFTYGHRMQIPRVKKGKDVELSVEIIDVDAHSGAKFKVQAYGYKLLNLKP